MMGRNGRRHCESCGREVDGVVVRRRERYEVYGEEVFVDAQVLTCPVCGEELFCEELDEETLLQAYRIYRERHHLLTPAQIRQIRLTYSLSQGELASLLGWSERTIRRFERGSLQDIDHDRVLASLQSPSGMSLYLEVHLDRIDPSLIRKVREGIRLLEKDGAYPRRIHAIGQMEKEPPSLRNGLRSFDFEKFSSMVLYLVAKGEALRDGMRKVKLLKLLHYADMLSFRDTGFSISGTPYLHFAYGPVPENYALLFRVMEQQGLLHIEVEKLENGYERHQVVAERPPLAGSLSQGERDILDFVYERFARFGSAEISDYSHREEGYRNTSQGECISYAYAKDIVFEKHEGGTPNGGI